VPVALAAILRSLPQQLGLQPENVIEDPIDTPAFQAMVREHTGAFQVPPQGGTEWSVDSRAATDLGLL
jgi:hypothetical protein